MPYRLEQPEPWRFRGTVLPRAIVVAVRGKQTAAAVIPIVFALSLS